MCFIILPFAFNLFWLKSHYNRNSPQLHFVMLTILKYTGHPSPDIKIAFDFLHLGDYCVHTNRLYTIEFLSRTFPQLYSYFGALIEYLCMIYSSKTYLSYTEPVSLKPSSWKMHLQTSDSSRHYLNKQ